MLQRLARIKDTNTHAHKQHVNAWGPRWPRALQRAPLLVMAMKSESETKTRGVKSCVFARARTSELICAGMRTKTRFINVRYRARFCFGQAGRKELSDDFQESNLK